MAQRRRRRAAFFLAGVGLSGVLVLAGSIGFVRLSAAGHLHTVESVPPAPVALVLGARVFPSGTPSPFLAARLDLAHRLYQAGKVRVVLVSGDNMAVEYNEPDAMRGYLIDAGMPPEAVVADYAGFDTYDSCARAKTDLRRRAADRGHAGLSPAPGRGHLPGARGGRDRRRRHHAAQHQGLAARRGP